MCLPFAAHQRADGARLAPVEPSGIVRSQRAASELAKVREAAYRYYVCPCDPVVEKAEVSRQTREREVLEERGPVSEKSSPISKSRCTYQWQEND